jgi:hypothetical protein
MKRFKYTSDGEAGQKGARTIHEALGIKRHLNLPYDSLASLDKALKTMNLVDMQSLAMKLGVKPISDRPRLSRAVTDQFVRLHKSYGAALQRDETMDLDGDNFDPSQF